MPKRISGMVMNKILSTSFSTISKETHTHTRQRKRWTNPYCHIPSYFVRFYRFGSSFLFVRFSLFFVAICSVVTFSQLLFDALLLLHLEFLDDFFSCHRFLHFFWLQWMDTFFSFDSFLRRKEQNYWSNYPVRLKWKANERMQTVRFWMNGLLNPVHPHIVTAIGKSTLTIIK